MRDLIDAFDWPSSPLGPRDTWPQSLRTTVDLVLASGFPMYVSWGPDYIQLYNDAFRPILGSTKHPEALGNSSRLTFHEIWDVIGPMFEEVKASGKATTQADAMMPLDRHGFLEECYFTFSYSAITAEGGKAGGVLVTCTETTEQVLSERHLRTLRDLGSVSARARSTAEACALSVETLALNPHDVPFTLLYLVDHQARRAHLAGSAGLAAASPVAPLSVDLSPGTSAWPLCQAAESGQRLPVECPPGLFGALPGGPWPEPAHRAVVLPVAGTGDEALAGLLITGVSARRPLDDSYLRFLDLVAGNISTAIGNARAYETERRRAESLAELDRAKTAFFSNVSHEFRTPLTLQLGPIEDVLADAEHPVDPVNRNRLEMAHRNSLRLLKLVNTLLDFSRIEAGRADAAYEPTDLAALTRDLASSFRSTMDRAGLAFVVECEPLLYEMFVDREMYEKIVLNLLSNAFKFTLQGQVSVSLRQDQGAACLEVRDTGVGIPADSLPRMFERFHRIKGQGGRTQEGSGIGLALVQELVKLHHGRIDVESEPGRGSTFRVFLPAGSSHLPPDRIGGRKSLDATTLRAEHFLEEALRWLPEGDRASRPLAPPAARTAPSPPPVDGDVVFVVDDNADMRDYLGHLLGGRYAIRAFNRGDAALEAARADPPGLVVSDVMMPGLDGFGLLRELRADARTGSVPVILLSARAGEEARVEALAAGADDHMVKPFLARELLARVDAHVALGRARLEARERETTLRTQAESDRRRLREFIQQAPASILIVRGPGHIVELVNRNAAIATGRPPEALVGRPLTEALPEVAQQKYAALLDRVYRTGEPHAERDARLRISPGEGRDDYDIYFDYVYQPLKDADGQVTGILLHGVDVTDRVRARTQTEASQAQLRLVTDALPGLVTYMDREYRYHFSNQAYRHWFGIDPASMIGRTASEIFGAAQFAQRQGFVDQALKGQSTVFEGPVETPAGVRHIRVVMVPDRGPDGEVRGIVTLSTDVSEQLAAAAALRRSEERYRLVAQATREAIWDWDLGRGAMEWNEGVRLLFGYDPADVVETAAWKRDRVHPGDREQFDRSFDALLVTGSRHWQEEYRFRRKDDSYAIVSDQAYVIHDEAGRPARVLGTMSDITEQRNTEQQLRQAQRMQAIGKLAGGIAHEVNNQMTAVLGFSEFALRQVGDAVVRRDIQQIIKAGTRAASITQQLLAFSRQQVLQPQVLRLNDVIDGLAPIFRQLLGADLQLDLHLLPDTGQVRVDRNQLEQVLINLGLNARDATPSGGTLTITTERLLVGDREGRVPGWYAMIRMTDTGTGMDAATLAQAFEPFFTTKAVGKGSGLGLSTVYGIITQSGGFVELESDMGRGTEVRVFLPSHAGPATAAGDEESRSLPSQGERILVVEDEESVRLLIGRSLLEAGYQVASAESGEAALDLAAAQEPDLVICDLVMPGLSGREVGERIAAIGPRIPVLYISGYPGEEVMQRGLLPEGAALLQKPFTPGQLAQRVREVLDGIGEPGERTRR